MDWGVVLFTFIIALIFCGIFAYSMHKDRSRYRNVVLLLFAAASAVIFILSFFGELGSTIILIILASVSLLVLVLCRCARR